MCYYVVCEGGDLRLITVEETNSTIEGSVQYCYNGLWSEVCIQDPGATSEWGLNEATVACRQLGYSDQGEQCSILPHDSMHN